MVQAWASSEGLVSSKQSKGGRSQDGSMKDPKLGMLVRPFHLSSVPVDSWIQLASAYSFNLVYIVYGFCLVGYAF